MKISDKYIFSDSGDAKVLKSVLDLKKGLSGTNDVVSQYENALANFFKSKFAIATSSGTAAIQVALFSLGVRSGDEVIISPTCPSMSVLPVIFAGAKPVFCDICKNNFGLDVNELKKVITAKTRAVIEVPMWGYPTRVDILKNFLNKKSIPLILDLAQAHGAMLNGKYLSDYGDVSCFSTHDRKILPTGEGGFILTNKGDIAKSSKGFTQFGNMDGKNFGLNYKLSALQSAIGLNRIKHINVQLEKRKRNALYVTSKINNGCIKEFDIVDGGAPNYYTLLLKFDAKNNQGMIKKMVDKGVPSDIIRYDYRVLYEYELFKKYGRKCRNAENLVKSITTIPVHPGLKKKELDYIINVINNN